MDDWKTQLTRVGAQAGMAYVAWDGHPEGSKFDRMSDDVKAYFRALVDAILDGSGDLPLPEFLAGHEAAIVMHIAAAAIQAVLDSNKGGVQLRLLDTEARELDNLLAAAPGEELAVQLGEALVA